MSVDLNNNIPRRERAPRKRTYKKTIVRPKEMGGDRQCILRNISDTGALLEFELANSLPMHFDVQVELYAMEVPAQWIRQEGERIGVKFTGPFKYIKAARKQVFKSPDDPILLRKTEEKARLNPAASVGLEIKIFLAKQFFQRDFFRRDLEFIDDQHKGNKRWTDTIAIAMPMIATATPKLFFRKGK